MNPASSGSTAESASEGQQPGDASPVSPGQPDQPQGARRGGETTFLQKRLQSLDAYRGLIMVLLAFNGFGLFATARNHLEVESGSSFWQSVAYQFEHVEWTGCGLWDMIQPSFMFMVGVAMAYSYASRQRRGDSRPKMLRHATWRAIALVLLGVLLRSVGREMTNWTFMDVVSQIGLGYVFLFLLWGRSTRTQAIAAAAILAGTWLLYMLYPGAGIDLAQGAPERGVSAEWAQEHLAGIGPAWHKNANVGYAVDRWFLNLFPRPKPYEFDSGGYQTINFLPSLATMLFGLMSGELLRRQLGAGRKLGILIVAGATGLALGLLLDRTGVCPIVKRIWTPAWAVYSTGICLLILAGLYAVVDVVGLRRWTFPLVVVGTNSIAIYCMGHLLRPWTERTLKTHFGSNLFLTLGPLYEPMLHYTLIGLVFWLICWWMYRQRFFIRI